MDETVKQKWLDALRSGDYEQGIDALRRTNGTDRFCCLGVLCDLYQGATGKGEWQGPHSDDEGTYRFIFVTPNDESRKVLPDDVIDWADLGVPQGALISPNALRDDKSAHYNLASLNDSNYSFSEIADVIEQEL